MGSLYIVSTPIGNLSDITLRALEILKQVDLIACEDTRRTSILLKHYKIDKPLFSFHEFNEQAQIPKLISRLVQNDNVALVTDAGTPAVSDPGFKLIRECVGLGIAVIPIPGVSAVIAALIASGLPTDKFLFLGFLPRKQSHAERLLTDLSQCLEKIKTTVIIFEAPHRLVKTLKTVKAVLGDRQIVICRELTKIHEQIRRESVSAGIDYFSQVQPKGEFTIVL